MLDGLRGLRDRADTLAAPESFASIADTGAVGGDVHRTRQGADPSALHELPSGRRPAAPRRREPAAPAAGRARHRRPWPAGDALLRSAIRTRISIPAACRAIRNGISRRARWLGRARRSPKSARRSRIPRATAAASRKDLDPPHRRRHAGRLGLGARLRPQPRAGHAKAGRRAGRGLGEDRRGLSREIICGRARSVAKVLSTKDGSAPPE